MGRRAKSIGLHLFEGNQSHLTKEEIEHRQESQIKLGVKKFRCPDLVMCNKVAKGKWNELIKIFQEDENDLVTSADVGIIERYCLLYADLREAKILKNQKVTTTTCSHDLFGEVEFIQTDLDDYAKISSVISKLSNELTKLEERLFVNPLARLKNVPPKQKEKESDPLKNAGFANV